MSAERGPFQFVEAHLKEADHHDVIWQNGWLGHSWEIHAQLLFQRIFKSVGEDIATKGQRAAQSFKEWLNKVPVKFKMGVTAGIFSAEVSTSGVPGFLHQVAQIDLVKLREELAQKKESKPFIVFADASLVWSQSKGARFYHTQSCPHAQRIEDDNKATGSPPKSLRAHGCVDNHQAKALMEAQSVIETLSEIKSRPGRPAKSHV